MFDRLASIIVRLRVVLLVGLLAVTALAAWQALQVRFDFSIRSLFLTADEDLQFLEEHRATFGDEDGVLLVLIEAEDVFDRAVLEVVQRTTERVEALEHVDQVMSLTNLVEVGGSPGLIEITRLIEELPETEEEEEALKAKTTSNPLFLQRFVNPEATATALVAVLEEGFIAEKARRPVLEALDRILEEARTDDIVLMASGVPIVNREYTAVMQSDMIRSIVASSLLICIVLAFLFRSTWGVALPMAAVGLAELITVAYMVLSGDVFNIINIIVPTLLLVIGVGDAVHFLATYYEELGRGVERQAAVENIVRKVGAACLLTSVTAAIGFASLIVARIDIIKEMGRVAAIGLMITYLVILALIPAVLALVRVPQAGEQHDPHEGRLAALLRWVAHITIDRRRAVLVWSTIVVVVIGSGAYRLKTDSFLLEELFKVNPVSIAMHHTEETLTGVMPVEIAIHAAEEGGIYEPEVLRAIEALQEHMRADPYIGHTISIADLVKEITFVLEGERRIPDTRKKVAQYLTFFEMAEDTSFMESLIDGPRRVARISASQKDWGTDQFFSWYDGSGECDPRAACGTPIKEVIAQRFGPLDGRAEARVTGSNLVAAKALSRLVEDMLASLGTAFLVITLLMMALLRSFRIGLISMIPNVLPLVITIGFMGWTGIPLRTATVMIFSVSLGVAANDTIHFLVRYRRELFRLHDREEAIRETMMSTGRAIIFTSVLLVFGFATMLTTRFVGIFQMGLLGAVTLFAALLGDLLILPVALGYFRPWSRLLAEAEAEAAAQAAEAGA